MPDSPPPAADDPDAPEGVPSEKGVAPEGGSVDFRCPECDAVMGWDPDADALLCAYCGARREVAASAAPIREYALEAAGEAARGLGLERRTSRCGECGATVAFDETATAAHCLFCGSARVLAEESHRNAIRPESLVPLDVGRAAAEESFRTWLRGLWFRPNALKRLATFQAVGVYVPFWTFDCDVHSVWTAMAGYTYYVTEHYTVRVGNRTEHRTRQVPRIRWVPAAGERDDVYDDLLVNASRGIDEGLARKLGEFDRKGLVAYRPEYLAGWAAEEYAVTLEEGWERGRARVEAEQRTRCSRDVPGDTQRDLRVRNRIADVRWKHVLLPMWSISFEWKGTTYPVLVHGQTGRVVGRAPISVRKILLLVLVVLAALALVVAIAGGFGLMAAR